MNRVGQYNIASVSRAFGILKLFDQNHREMTLTEISELSGVNKSSVLRVLATMEYEGILKYNPETKKYRLGIIIYKLAASAFDFLDIKDLARDILKRAADESELMLHLAVVSDGQVYVVDKVYPARNGSAMEMVSRVGGTVPVHCTGVGKVLTAFADGSDRELLLSNCEYERYTEHTITTRAQFETLLQQVRQQGYAVNDCEHEPYIRCVTFPVFDHAGKIAAAVSITGFVQVMTPDTVEQCKDKLKEATNQISRELGYGFTSNK